MNILFIKKSTVRMQMVKYFFVGFMVYEIPRVPIFGHCPYSATFPYE